MITHYTYLFSNLCPISKKDVFQILNSIDFLDLLKSSYLSETETSIQLEPNSPHSINNDSIDHEEMMMLLSKKLQHVTIQASYNTDTISFDRISDTNDDSFVELIHPFLIKAHNPVSEYIEISCPLCETIDTIQLMHSSSNKYATRCEYCGLHLIIMT